MHSATGEEDVWEVEAWCVDPEEEEEESGGGEPGERWVEEEGGVGDGGEEGERGRGGEKGRGREGGERGVRVVGRG